MIKFNHHKKHIGVTKYFNSLSKGYQKQFLTSIGKITNSQLREISDGLKPKVLNDLVEKHGYETIVSAFVSSTSAESTN